MAKNSPHNNLVSSALRIYLAHTLHQTQDFIRTGHQSIFLSTQFFSNIENKGVSSSHNWKIVRKATSKVSDYIHKCQFALESSPCLAPVFSLLSALEASQDSLYEMKKATQSYNQDDYKQHVDLSEKYACKATYLMYAYEAIHRHGDHILSQLWLAAARKLDEHITLRLKVGLKMDEQAVKKYLQKAEWESTIIARQKLLSDARKQFHTCAVRQYRRAAAMTALDRKHAHDYYAEVYLKASATRVRNDCASSSPEITILERAASHLQLAINLIESDEQNGNAMLSDSNIRYLVNAADILRNNSHRAIEFVTTIEAQKAQLATTIAAEGKERDATMLQVWQILRMEQEKAIRKSQIYIDSVLVRDGDIVAGLESMTSIDAALKTVTDTIKEIEICHKRITLYTHKATLTLPTARLSQLSSQSWTQAAVQMRTAAQVCTDFIITRAYLETSLDQHPEWKLESESAKGYVTIAESYMGRAVEYLNKARGAEAGVKCGRDPREAQMWRIAAECLSDKAEQMLQESVKDELSSVSEGFDTAVDLNEMIRVYSQAAEYYNLCIKHRTLHNAEIRQNGTRVADLYERLAILKSRVCDVEVHDAVTTAAIDFYVRAIDKFNQPTVLSVEELTWWERDIECTVHAFNPLPVSEYAAIHRRSAFMLTKEISNLFALRTNASVVLARGLIALHACAAEATEPRARIVYEACIAELSTLVSMTPGYYSPPNRQYKLALVAHMVRAESTLVDSEVFSVPSDVQNVVNLAMGHGYRTSLLDEHVHALLLRAQCLHCLEMLTDPEQNRECWEEAYSATIDLCQAYTLCSIERPMGQNSPRLLSYLAYRKAVAQRLVAKAEAVVPVLAPQRDLFASLPEPDSDEEKSLQWPETSAATATALVDNRIALVAVEQYTWAAEQVELQATSEAYLRQNKLKSLGRELKRLAEYAQKWAMCPTDDSARFCFIDFEADAQGTIAQLRREHIDVTPYSVFWGR